VDSFIREYEQRTLKSRKLYDEARKFMPGGVCHNLRYFPPHPLYISRADGSRVWDVDGNEYIDLWMGHLALILGHRPSIMNKALEDVERAGAHWGIVNEYQVELARLICEMVPCAEKMRFCVSGTEANMYAVRLARGFTGRRTIIKMEGGWHGGSTDLTSAITAPFDKPESAGIPSEMARLTRAITFNDVDGALETIHDCGDDLAAVILEPVMGAGGAIPAEKEFLEVLRKETSRTGALLIFDEVITGFRLAPGGAGEHYGIVPDIATLGKIAGGGSNIGIIAGRADILELCDPSISRRKGEAVLVGGGTFSATPMSMISGLALLGHLRDHAQEIYPALNEKGGRLREGIEEAFQRIGFQGRTIGIASLCGIYLPKDAGVVIRNAGDMHTMTDVGRMEHEFRIRLLNNGIYTVHGGGALSMAHSDEDIETIIHAVENVAKEMINRG